MPGTVTTQANGILGSDEILTLTVLGNEAVEKGSLFVFEDVQDKMQIGRMTNEDDIIQVRSATPTNEKGEPDYDEQELDPKEMMVYYRFNPRIYEPVWREFQPEGPLVDRVLDPEVQRALLQVTNDKIQKQLGELIWQGNNALATSSPLHFFSGYITRAAASADTIDVANIGVITAANVIAILEDVVQAIPDAIFDNSDLVIHMNTGDFRKYQEALRALDFKGSDLFEAGAQRFGGFEIRHYTGLPANSIMTAVSNANQSTTNMFGAVDMADDDKNILIEKWRPESELHFVKLLFKMDVNCGFFQEVVLYQGS